MASVKTACPQCQGQGLVGTGNASICPQCTGTGMITVDDNQTFATINASNTGTNKVPLVVTIPPAIPPASQKVNNRGK